MLLFVALASSLVTFCVIETQDAVCCADNCEIPRGPKPHYYVTLWRNGSASDSRSEGCVFKSRQGQRFSHLLHQLSDIYNDT